MTKTELRNECLEYLNTCCPEKTSTFRVGEALIKCRSALTLDQIASKTGASKPSIHSALQRLKQHFHVQTKYIDGTPVYKITAVAETYRELTRALLNTVFCVNESGSPQEVVF